MTLAPGAPAVSAPTGRAFPGQGPGRRGSRNAGSLLMAIHVALHHKTAYRYDRLVNLGPQVVRLRPAPHCRTPILSYSLKVKPEPHFLNWQQDPQGNYLARLVFPKRRASSPSRSTSWPRWRSTIPSTSSSSLAAENFPFAYDEKLGRRTRALPAQGRPHLRARLRRLRREHRPHAHGARSISSSPSTNASTASSATSSASSPACSRPRKRWKLSGSCRDSALAARAGAPPLRPRRPLRLRLPDSARPTRSPSTARRAPTRTSPTSMRGARSTCPAPAGSASTRPPACSPAKATSRSPAPPSRPAPRPSPAGSTNAKSRSTSR
jgi:transglutaminase-like putative cysteine protease